MSDEPLPYLTADCPGMGGILKQQPEDFRRRGNPRL